jgi:hypothetical protein
LNFAGAADAGTAKISATSSVIKSDAYLSFILFFSTVETPLPRPESSNKDRILPDQGRRIPYMRGFCRYERATYAVRDRKLEGRLNAASDERPFEGQGVCEAS